MSRDIGAPEREDRGSDVLQKELTREEVKKCVAKLKNKEAAGADES